MEILDEGALDKALNTENKTPDEKPWKRIYEIIDEIILIN